MVKWLVQGIAFLVVASITELALSQTCPQSSSTINSFLTNYQKSQISTVVYAWTGAHLLANGVWADRKNSTDVIISRSDGGSVSQEFSSVYSHGTSSDASSASASAQCNDLPNCLTASLVTSACVTSKVDSAGAGAYARAGVTVPPQSKTAKKSTVTINIPNRMALTSNVGDETGVWGIAVSVEKVAGQKTLGYKGQPDIAPFLVDLLGLQNVKQFKVHSDTRRTATFVAGFEFAPRGTNVKLIEPASAFWVNMTAEQRLTAKAALATLANLSRRFVINPCDPEDTAAIVGQDDKKCLMAEYRLQEGETISIVAPYEFPDEPKTSSSDQILYIETALGGRDVVQIQAPKDLAE